VSLRLRRVPTFCRHNRFVQNCPICGEPEPAASQRAAPRQPRTAGGSRGSGGSSGRRTGVLVRRAERSADDGYRTALAPGLRATADAERLADEMAFAAGRLAQLGAAPPGLYAEVAASGDVEEAAWLAFLIAYLGPLDDDDPFAGVRAARVPWASGEAPALDDVAVGPRGAHEPARGLSTVNAYRAWAARAGSQAAAFAGEAAWPPDRRFGRAFERLALPGLHRSARYELLVTLGRLGVCDVRAGALQFSGGGDDPVVVAAKRVFGIGDPLLLERRAADLAGAADVPIEALDLALFNWAREGERTRGGVDADSADPDARERAADALGV